MNETARESIFVSYARADKDAAYLVARQLERVGYRVSLATTTTEEDGPWIQVTEEGIRPSCAVVVVISDKSRNNTRIMHEARYAQNKGKMIIPILIDGCAPPSYLADLSPIDCSQGVAASVPEIVNALARLREPGSSGLIGGDGPSADDTRGVTGLESVEAEAFMMSRQSYLDRLFLKYSVWRDQYTPMAGVAEFLEDRTEYTFRTAGTAIDQEFELFLSDERPIQRPASVLKEVPEDVLSILGPSRERSGNGYHPKRAVILGEPGAGKTTSLWRLAIDYCEAAQGYAAGPIPLLVPLGNYDQDVALEEYAVGMSETLLGDLVEFWPSLLDADRLVLLLDGMNEIPRQVVRARLAAIRAFLRKYPNIGMILTCRAVDYPSLDLGLDKVHIKPLDPLRIRKFIRSYIVEEGAGDQMFWQLAGPAAEPYWRQFSGRGVTEREFWVSHSRPRERPWHQDWDAWVRSRDNPRSMLILARNPFFLYMMARVYAKIGLVPENMGQLFHTFASFLIGQELRKASDEVSRLDGDVVIRSSSYLAFGMQSSGEEGTLISREAALGHLSAGADEVPPESMLRVAEGANLLVVRDGTVQFTHQLLQEYFCATRLDELRKSKRPALEFWPQDSWWDVHHWDESAILMAGFYASDASEVVTWVAQGSPELAAKCIAHSGAQVPRVPTANLVRGWNNDLSDDNMSPLARAGIARGLGILDGDERPGVGVVEGLPDISWSEPIVIGGTRIRFSRYLVTNKQFEVLRRRENREIEPFWPNAGLAWMSERIIRVDGSPSAFPNHPRVYVKWYEAVAFCRWLSARLGAVIRLPTESEWSQGVKGINGGAYSYGDSPDAHKANCRETGLGETSAVGVFGDDVSQHGLLDVSGNVRQWCLNAYDRQSERATDVEVDEIEQSDWRAVRGGAFDADMSYFGRLDTRNFRSPSDAARNIGLRIVRVV